MNTRIAKYNGTCVISGQPIIAGQTQVTEWSGHWIIAEYANRDAVLARAKEIAAPWMTYGQMQRAIALIESGPSYNRFTAVNAVAHECQGFQERAAQREQ